MQASAQICRAQEERQRALARNSVLPNVRLVAARAAAAWEKEALAAEKREARGADAARRRSDADSLSERVLCENPDRGLADA